MSVKYAKPSVATFIALAITANINVAQQPAAPSQRFEPVRNVPSSRHAPPSVHVPAGQIRSLNSAPPRGSTGPGFGNANSHQGGTSFNFSDTPNAAAGTDTNSRGARQVSHVESPAPPKAQAFEVPAVLRGSPSNKSPLESFLAKPQTTQAPQPTSQSLQPPTDDATAADRNIVVDESNFEQDRREVELRLNELRQLQQQASRPVTDVQQVAYVQQPETTEATAIDASQNAFVEDVPGAVQTAEHFTSPISGAGSHSPISTVRQVSVESEIVSGASLKLTTPAILVQAFGPDSVGINKLATYKITITNDSALDADKIKVGIDFPESVDLQNFNLTTGNHEITDGVEQSRLVWTVDRVAAKTTHTIAINAIPRSAEPFDMKVNWSFAPQAGTTHVRVTEPRLAMKITGPVELMFGEKALYDVTISNPGTGEAEQVTVALPEALGGERTMIGNIPAGGEKRFNVELLARTAGKLDMSATARADGDIAAAASHDIIVRRANLAVAISGPAMKYAGSEAQYEVKISNTGDATASDVMAVIALPSGVQYVSGVNNAETSEVGMKWNVGTLTAGDQRVFNISCLLNSSGDLLFEAGARGAGDLAGTAECRTKVDTIADLVLTVEDPKGPLPTGEDVSYRMRVTNRGTRSANGVNVVMQFSEGIEPTLADGFKHKIVTGQVVFDPIGRIEPGQEMVLNVSAKALKSGTHVFRAQLTCEESESREVAEGNTRFFGDDITLDGQQINLPDDINTANADDEVTPKADTNDFK